MESTSLYRMGALALSATALVFVVWTAAAPGCATPDQVVAEPAANNEAPATDEAAQGKAADPTPPTPLAPAPEGDDAKEPRFMGASKAAVVWDEDHVPGGGKGGKKGTKSGPSVAPQAAQPPPSKAQQ